jgi:nitrilase
MFRNAQSHGVVWELIMNKLTKFKAAVCQVSPCSKPEMLDKIEKYATEAASNGARLILFPEGSIGGYPRGNDFGCNIGFRGEKGRDDFMAYWKNAVDIPGPEISRLCSIAKKNNIFICTGVIERDGHTVYCTAVFIGADGKYLGKHRKLMPTGSERLIWGFGNGSTMPVIDTELGKMGAVICWENYMPLLRTAMYGEGIELYLAPTADGRETWLPTMRHIAMEGRCFVLTSNIIAHRNDYAENYGKAPTEKDNKLVSFGGACIVDPFGKVLAGPNYDKECVLYADIDRDQIARGKFDMDVVGHYARPDVFQLKVNRSDTRPVTSFYSDDSDVFEEK